MRELNDAAEKAKALFGINESTQISGNWAKWYHEGIPDGPVQERLQKRQVALMNGHCFNCTALSGCYFIDGDKTCPVYPQHPHCDCEKPSKSPSKVEAICDIEKDTILKNSLGKTSANLEYLKYEFARQGKEKYISGDYTLAELNEYGQQINIDISINTTQSTKQRIKSTWLVQPNGLITCKAAYVEDIPNGVDNSINNDNDELNPDSSSSTTNQEDTQQSIPDYIPYPSTKLPKFKKGDRVRLIRERYEYELHGIKKGVVGYVVSEYSLNKMCLIAFSKDDNAHTEIWIYENDLELIDTLGE